MRNRRAERQSLAELASQRPRQPSRSTNHRLDRYLLPGRQLGARRQTPTSNHQRNHAAIRPRCACADEPPAEPLDVDPRERGRVSRQTRPRPGKRRRDQSHEHHHHDGKNPECTPSRAPAGTPIASAQNGRGRRSERHLLSIRTTRYPTDVPNGRPAPCTGKNVTTAIATHLCRVRAAAAFAPAGNTDRAVPKT